MPPEMREDPARDPLLPRHPEPILGPDSLGDAAIPVSRVPKPSTEGSSKRDQTQSSGERAQAHSPALNGQGKELVSGSKQRGRGFQDVDGAPAGGNQ